MGAGSRGSSFEFGGGERGKGGPCGSASPLWARALETGEAACDTGLHGTVRHFPAYLCTLSGHGRTVVAGVVFDVGEAPAAYCKVCVRACACCTCCDVRSLPFARLLFLGREREREREATGRLSR